MSTQKLSPWESAAAGATGAVLANALVYPLDIVKTRLQVQVTRREAATVELADGPALEKGRTAAEGSEPEVEPEQERYSSTWDALSKIVDQEGLAGLYSGFGSSLVGVASTNFAYFYWYSVVRKAHARLSPSSGPRPSTGVELSLGAVAGALAQLFTIPVAVVTTRQQTQPRGARRGFLATAREVVEGEDGPSGLWRGLKASLVLVVNPAITYGAYQRLRERVFPGKAVLRPAEAFLLGALSKAVATVVTQPLIVAKVGLQSRPPPERRGRPFGSFVEVLRFILAHEGVAGLFKGIGPQIVKGLLVQGLLMMTKERMELVFVVLTSYLRSAREARLKGRAGLVG